MTFIAVDLDSTLCDTSQRHWMIEKINDPDSNTHTWDDYSMECIHDQPIVGTLKLVQILHEHGFTIALISGRSELARKMTENWLSAFRCPYDILILRADGSREANHLFKRRTIIELQIEFGRCTLLLDDWPPVAQELAKDGVPTLVVVPPYNYAKVTELN